MSFWSSICIYRLQPSIFQFFHLISLKLATQSSLSKYKTNSLILLHLWHSHTLRTPLISILKLLKLLCLLADIFILYHLCQDSHTHILISLSKHKFLHHHHAQIFNQSIYRQHQTSYLITFHITAINSLCFAFKRDFMYLLNTLIPYIFFQLNHGKASELKNCFRTYLLAQID